MLNMTPTYSILLYRTDLSDDLIDRIKDYVLQGIKIFLLTMDSEINDLGERDAYLKLAIDGHLLNPFLVPYHDTYLNRELTLIDGQLSEDVHEWLSFFGQASDFNQEQYLLEHTGTSDHIIVKAGAGTGKTRTMINRVLYLKHIEPHLPLQQIVLLTFTNEAAREMRERLIETIQLYFHLTRNPVYLTWIEEAADWFVGTIHAFARKFLSEQGTQLGLTPNITVRSYRHDKRRFIEQGIDLFAKEYPVEFERFKKIQQYQVVSTIHDLMGKIEQKALPHDELVNADYGSDDWGAHHLFKFVIAFVQDKLQKLKSDRNAVEIADLIRLLKPLTNQHEVNKTLSALNISYLMVDEFQDTDEVQVQFIAWLVKVFSLQLFVVGDTKQSIYRFRGADYTAFKQLENYLRSMGQSIQQFSLVKNYRTHKHLLDELDTMFQQWARWIKRFHYHSDDRLLPTKINVDDDQDVGIELLELDDLNLKCILKRIEGNDVAILVRSNRKVDEVVDRCNRLGFFCDAKRQGTFYRTLPVREFYLLIRRFTHPTVWTDRYSFHISSYGEYKLDMERIFNAYSPEKRYLNTLLNAYDQFDGFENEFLTRPVIAVLEKLVNELKPDYVFAQRLYNRLKRQHTEKEDDKIRREVLVQRQEYAINLEHLFYILKKEFADYPASLFEIEDFLSIKMKTDTDISAIRLEGTNRDRIKVMTVHQAKGLEFNYVLLPETKGYLINRSGVQMVLQQHEDNWQIGYGFSWGLDDGRIVNTHMERFIAEEDQEVMGEETRLLYVAMTRAKKAVYASVPYSIRETHKVKTWQDLLVVGQEALIGV